MNVIARFHAKATLPKLAPASFEAWFKRRKPTVRGANRRVLLWPDTLSNYFAPQTAQAAVRVLEAAGYEVEIPTERLCCGRPLYESGLLDQAKEVLCKTLKSIENDIEAGIPVIGLEPSCVSVFRDELTNLLPNDPLATRLASQTKLLCEFLADDASFTPSNLHGKAVIHRAEIAMERALTLLWQFRFDGLGE
ncbi:heterodisulfide reductase-related iron-sulfur binding cluster [Methylocystis sp. IM3]|uniref:(Fe-S)-binding protein n=1 Tax=unclassified Methylocystis TaxID=2625913 RepID=UPI0030FB4A9A